MERLYLQGIGYGVGKTPAKNVPITPVAEPESAGKMDWKQQKEEQAKARKRAQVATSRRNNGMTLWTWVRL